MTLYRSVEEAYARVDQLRKQGIWPGVITHTGPLAGAWSLTYDPGDTP